MVMGNLAGTGQALDSSLNTIYSEFKLLRDETGVFRSCATVYKLLPHEGRSKNVNNYNRVTAFDLADGVDMQQAQQLADTTTSYSPGEVGVQVLLPGSTMRRVADPDLLARTGRMLANAYDLKEDQDGGLQMVNFTPIMGVADATLGPGEYLGALNRLAIGNNQSNPEPPPGEYYIVDHPLKLAILATRLVPISDTGVGIPADMLEAVFKPFSKADSSFTRRHGGTGLGLPIAKGLVEAHGGTLTVTSSPGRGTIVRIMVPQQAGLPALTSVIATRTLSVAGQVDELERAIRRVS